MPFITVTYPPKYPLTESEKKWLAGREEIELKDGYYFCAHCGLQNAQWNQWTGWCEADCVMENAGDFRDAAEFESREQKHLMYQYEKTVSCAEITGGFCPNRETMLMFARLAVEAEMEAEASHENHA